MTDTKARAWRTFWATQDRREADGIYVMSEDEPFIIDCEAVGEKFKVVELKALEALQKENGLLRSQRDQLHKILKEKNLAKEIDDSRIPKGFQRVEAYSNGTDFVILGEPEETHSCDQMGCGSLDHVIFRSSYLKAERDAALSMLRRLCDRLERLSAEQEWIVPENPRLKNWKDACTSLVAEATLAFTEAKEFLEGAER